MYSVYKLNKQHENIQPWCIPFPIWNQSVVPCSVLTVASWPAYRFLRRQVRWSGIPISFRIFQFIVIHTVKGFGIVNKAGVDVFLELSCFFNDPMDLAIWFLVPLPFLKPVWTSFSLGCVFFFLRGGGFVDWWVWLYMLGHPNWLPNLYLSYPQVWSPRITDPWKPSTCR